MPTNAGESNAGSGGAAARPEAPRNHVQWLFQGRLLGPRNHSPSAILLYLAEKAGKLPADGAGRAAVVQWCFAALATLEPPVALLQLIDGGGVPGGGDEQRAALVGWAGRAFDGLERWLDGRTPRLRAYYDRAMARPAWQRTLEIHAERLFCYVRLGEAS